MYYLAVCVQRYAAKRPQAEYGGKEKTLLKWSNILQLQEQGREKV